MCDTNFQVSLYFLSAISQSMAALFAISGIFAIYQFQRVDTMIEHICSSYRNRKKNTTLLNKDVKANLFEEYVRIPDNKENKSSKHGLLDRLLQLEELERFLQSLKCFLWVPTLLIAVVFVSSLLLFPSLPNAGLTSCQYNTLLVLVIFAAVSVIGFMCYAFRGSPEILFNNDLIILDNELKRLRKELLDLEEPKVRKRYISLREDYKKKLNKLISKRK